MSTKHSLIFSNDSADEKGLTVEICIFSDEPRVTQLDLSEPHDPDDQNESSYDSPSAVLNSHLHTGVTEDESSTPKCWNNSWGNADDPLPGWAIAGPDWCPAPTDGPPKENWRQSKRRPESKSWLHHLSFEKPGHALSDAEYKDLMDLHVLPLKTRLEDDDWLDSCLEHVRVDDERLFRLLTRGREVAQKCLWAFMDRHRPEIRRREFPGGWQQVKLEVSGLMPIVDRWALRFRQNNPRLARDALFAVVPLRHLTCHWNKHDLGWSRPAARTVDAHLKNVQKLAIHLYDEEHAAEARMLRDEAHQAVHDTIAEIEALEPLLDVCSWQYHHEQMFEQVKFAKEENDPHLFRYPDVILRAAEAWSRRRFSLDQTSEEDTISGENTNTVEDQQPQQAEEKHADAGKKSANTMTNQLPVIGVTSRRHSIS